MSESVGGVKPYISVRKFVSNIEKITTRIRVMARSTYHDVRYLPSRVREQVKRKVPYGFTILYRLHVSNVSRTAYVLYVERTLHVTVRPFKAVCRVLSLSTVVRWLGTVQQYITCAQTPFITNIK